MSDTITTQDDIEVQESTKVLSRFHGRESLFAKAHEKTYKNRFKVTLLLDKIAGGIPTDPRVAEGWLRTKLADDRDDLIRQMAAEVMVERGVDLDEAVSIVENLKHLNGFKRLAVENAPIDPDTGKPKGHLYIEGRQVKAMIREAASIAFANERWGPTRKGTKSFFAEHVFVLEDYVPLFSLDPEVLDSEGVTPETLKPVFDPTDINQRFIHTFRGNGISYEEVVEDGVVTFTVVTDHDFTADQWGKLWSTGEMNGLGAARSQDMGRFLVIGWEKLK